MSTKTANYQLNQWEPSDPFLRADFNEDNAKIDAAIAGKAEQTALTAGLAQKADAATVAALQTQVAAKCGVVCGTYSGGGESSRTIELGFAAKAVLVVSYGGVNMGAMDGLHVQLAIRGTDSELVSLTDTGFTVKGRLLKTDYYWSPHFYLAFY